ncbi:hypothetical protein BDQ12DRAFT_663093 [Crucibulum laeve]|uniref:B30.2/SPRY domain-containing protein n=1 Tax=Crucibulum laeve TaxID=68775 RepID=A0A5C3MCD6_9AGAR|nr:hypothetical protein BDQ12DRAFT_663093 [Crucibulum laeve]
MFVDSSPPPEMDVLPAYPSNSGSATPSAAHTPGTHSAVHNRKRKRAPPTASSPAPSDPGSIAGANTPTEILVSRADLSSRPILAISRGPTFVPALEGSEFYRTEFIGVNRHGFRYVPAGINPPGHAQPCRTIESNPTAFRVSWEDRSPFLRVTKDGLEISGTKGFRSARCNAPIREGNWYMEVKIVHGGGEFVGDEVKSEGSHVRLGWGRREAPLNGPAGLDGYSYGYRDKTGDKVTLSRPRPYGRPFGSGDVIGMYISLPSHYEADKDDPHDPAHIKRERIPIELKGQEYFEILEYPQSKEMTALMDHSGKSTNSASLPSSSKKSLEKGKLPERGGPINANKTAAPALRPLPTLPASRIAFFVNGESQGIAFQDIYDYLQLRQSNTQRKAKEKKRTREGVKEHRENPFDDGTLGYYPFISLFNDARVRLNPGPDFDFPPPADIDALLDGTTPEPDIKRTWRPTCERYPEFMAEQWAIDAQEEEEAKVEMARQAEVDHIEEEKRVQRNKKRQQAEARKRAKKAEQQAALGASAGTSTPGSVNTFGLAHTPSTALHIPGSSTSSTIKDEDRHTPVPLIGLGISGIGNYPNPSPLRHATNAYNPEGSIEYEDSPAPTYASSGEFRGEQSGYNSETAHDDAEMEFLDAVDADLERES